MNKRYNDLRKAGYSTTGISCQDWKTDSKQIVTAQADKYKVDGNKVAIVQKTEVSNFRDRTDKTTYWVALVLFSEQYKIRVESERIADAVRRRNAEVLRVAEGFSLDELLLMVKSKSTKEI